MRKPAAPDERTLIGGRRTTISVPIDQSTESTLAGELTEAGLAGDAGLAGLAGEAGLAGLGGVSTEAGLTGEAGLSTEAGETGEFVEAGDGGDVVEAGDTMLSLSTRKSRSPEVVPSSSVVEMPGTERPVAFSMRGIALATLAAPPAMTPRLRAEAAPTAIQFLVSMMVLPLRAVRLAVDEATLARGHEITRRRW
jgi:hypothetical protein